MAALHASAATSAPADVYIELPHKRPDRRQVFLILSRDPRVLDDAATVRTGQWQRHVANLIDRRRHRPVALPSIAGARLAARSTRMHLRGALREGRGLAESGAPRRIQLLPEALVFAAQSLPLPLAPLQIALQAGHVFPQLLDTRLARAIRRPIDALTHALVMPESARSYKSDPVINYPDSNKLFKSIDSKGGLVAKGFIVKVGDRTFRLAAGGIAARLPLRLGR